MRSYPIELEATGKDLPVEPEPELPLVPADPGKLN
jgi:hypothetical protein